MLKRREECNIYLTPIGVAKADESHSVGGKLFI